MTAAAALAVLVPAGAASGGTITPARATTAPGVATGTGMVGAPDAGAGAEARTVTLVTGDRVTVLGGATGSGGVSVEPGAGRSGMTFQTRTAGGRLRVVPGDALPLLAEGRLDPELFDVTRLLEYGYDDRRGELPLLLGAEESAERSAGRRGERGGTAGPASARRTATAARAAGARVVRELPRTGLVAVRQPRARAGAVWRGLVGGPAGAGRSTVWLDGRLRPALDVSVPQIGAPAAWQAGYTGRGVRVAVLDSGIDDTHPDLAGRVVARSNFTDGLEDDRDLVGHGTHVASTLAGSGSASGGRYRGVAPDSQLLDGKVCVVDGCPESAILAGMEWAAAEQGARVVNLSLGGPDSPGVDPLEEAVDRLSDQYGTLFVVAAGNDGFRSSVNSPGSADAALTVGAVDGSDALADFSSRGPRVGDGAIKPDLTAPGVGITAARGRDATGIGGAPGDPYVAASGTSMATPHVAGAAALLAQQHPDWPGSRLKAVLTGSAKPGAGLGAYEQGAGRVDLGRAIGQRVTADPPSLDLGEQRWPHDDDRPTERTVTYHNSGTGPVTFALGTSATAADGTPVPAGVFTVSPATVTVPAGGAARVTVTADTRVGGPDGELTGALVASAGAESVRTPFVLRKEVESYDLTLRSIGRDGAPGLTMAEWHRIDGGRDPDPSPFLTVQDTAVVRLPKGRYLLTGTSFGDRTAPVMAVLVQPGLDVDGDKTVTLDARLATKSTIGVPRSGASQVAAQFTYRIQTPNGPIGGGQSGRTFDDVRTGQLGDPTPVPGFHSSIDGLWAQVGADGDPSGSPYTYSVSHHEAGRMISGYRRQVAPAELATIETRAVAGDDPGLRGGWYAVNRVPGEPETGEVVLMGAPFPLPSTRTHYVNTDGGLQWRAVSRQYWTDPANGDQWLWWGVLGPWTGYQAGRTYRETWGAAVAGPVLPGPEDWGMGAARGGDVVAVRLSPYGDGAGRPGREIGEGTTLLYRDGVKVGESPLAGRGEFTVPAAPAGYRLELHASRGTPFQLSTRTDVVWTFRSGHVDGTAALPLWTVRFSPVLDDRNAAPAGREFPVPVTASPNPGAQVGKLRELTVEASYDDGATWNRVPVRDGAAQVRHPAGAGFVSLRATAADGAGNTVRQTVVRAYRYGPA